MEAPSELLPHMGLSRGRSLKSRPMLQFPKLPNFRRKEGKVPSSQLLSIFLGAMMPAEGRGQVLAWEIYPFLPLGTDYNPGLLWGGVVRVLGDEVGGAQGVGRMGVEGL